MWTLKSKVLTQWIAYCNRSARRLTELAYQLMVGFHLTRDPLNFWGILQSFVGKDSGDHCTIGTVDQDFQDSVIFYSNSLGA